MNSKLLDEKSMTFINEKIKDNLDFKSENVSYFLESIQVKDSCKMQISKILKEAEQFPAALGGYHGDYIGGLYDHVLLVTNLTKQLYKEKNYLKQYIPWFRREKVGISENYDEIDLNKAILTALYHDFGKVPYYAYKLKLKNRKIFTNRHERDYVSTEIHSNFKYSGNDPHVDECIAVLKRYDLPFDNEICRAIIFHHGRWSRYKPFRPNKLSELIHAADMIASQIFKI
jgi:hypothetical protein